MVMHGCNYYTNSSFINHDVNHDDHVYIHVIMHLSLNYVLKDYISVPLLPLWNV